MSTLPLSYRQKHFDCSSSCSLRSRSLPPLSSLPPHSQFLSELAARRKPFLSSPPPIAPSRSSQLHRPSRYSVSASRTTPAPQRENTCKCLTCTALCDMLTMFTICSLSGAVAELFDISCLAGKPAFKTIQDTALTIFKLIPDKFINNQNRGRLTGPLSLLSSGKHYFTPKGASNPPVWDMRSTGPRAVLGKAGAYVVGSKKAGIPAPTGAKDIDWLEVNGVEGQLATTIYRTDTRGGQPPASVRSERHPLLDHPCSPYICSINSAKRGPHRSLSSTHQNTVSR